MMQTRAYTDERHDPVVVLVATGTHDVSRLTNLLNGASPNSEQRTLGARVVEQLQAHNSGLAALRLLRDHGGPDFTETTEQDRLRTTIGELSRTEVDLRSAAAALVHAVDQVRDVWTQADARTPQGRAVRNGLWEAMHAAADEMRAALARPSTGEQVVAADGSLVDVFLRGFGSGASRG